MTKELFQIWVFAVAFQGFYGPNAVFWKESSRKDSGILAVLQLIWRELLAS